MSENAEHPQLEIGHILFIDLVGYSKLTIDEQKTRLGRLTEIVLGTSQVAKSTDEQLIRLPTGDGMALVFRDNSAEPARCALEVSQALKDYPDIVVRMGVNSGPVSEITDVSGRTNIAGPGINMAQRVMDCGNAGHILVSARTAEDLEAYQQWKPLLHSLGDCEVKHGIRLGLFNLYDARAGNAELPAKLKNVPAKKKIPLLLVLALVLAIGGGILWRFAAISPMKSEDAGQANQQSVSSPVTLPDKSIAVLPFENLSDDKAAAYFADGIQDEILTKLAAVADLKVISRTSTAKYKSKPEDLKTVSQQLGVATILEGSVQKAQDKVHVNVQLIDARTDSHLWAKSYDRDLKDVFAVESEVAQEIADSLQARLSPDEHKTMAAAPTQDMVAYDLFLKGEHESRLATASLKAESFDQAAAWYEQAIARDPKFALAMARLVETRMTRFWFLGNFDEPTEAELAEIKKIADRSLSVAPELAEAHVAQGIYHYYGYRRYDEALAEFRRAIELQPNNAPAREYTAYVHRRQGEWDLCASELKQALEQDPRNADVAGNLAETYVNMRQWKDGSRVAAQALEIDPHDVIGMRVLLRATLNGSGDVSEAVRVLATFPPNEKIAVASSNGGVVAVTGDRAYTFVVARDFPAALKVWSDVSGTPIDQRKQLASQAIINLLAGNLPAARFAGEEARKLLEERPSSQGNEALSRRQLVWSYLALDRKAEAIKVAQEVVDSLPPEKDALLGAANLSGLAEVQARARAAKDCVANLRRLLNWPAGACVSIARLKNDPVWDPIRDDPGFRELLAGKELVGSGK